MTERYFLDIPTLLGQLPSNVYKSLGNDFFLARLNYDESMEILKYPARFNGFLAFFCLEGMFNLDINLKSYEVREGSLIIYTPGNIVKVTSAHPDNLKNLKFILVAASEEFATGVKIDFNRLYEDSLLALENPCITLDSPERNILKQYLELAESLMVFDIPNKIEAIKSLGSSIFYLLGTIWKERLNTAKANVLPRKMRANSIFQNFLKLVAEHHGTEQNVSFYADRLFLTPKYLSKLIKDVSGRSAPEWIDSFVILETKNLLKYSDMSIKEISFTLNFSSISSFYKFFHKKTGMTPAAYREML